jgi:hypothetical protein
MALRGTGWVRLAHGKSLAVKLFVLSGTSSTFGGARNHESIASWNKRLNSAVAVKSHKREGKKQVERE